MFYLINTDDNSYNSHKETPFTEREKEGTYEVFYTGTLPEGDISFSFFDPVKEEFYFEADTKILTPEESAQIAEEERLTQEQQAELMKNQLLNEVLDKLRPVLTPDQLDAIGNFNTTSDEDMALLEEALDETAQT